MYENTRSPKAVLYPITPENRGRYDKPTPRKLEYIDRHLPAGLQSRPASSASRTALPGWSRHTHPEGEPYFSLRLASTQIPSLQILTEDWIHNWDIRSQLADVVEHIQELLVVSSDQTIPSALEVFVKLQQGGDGGCGYYLISHSAQTIFWLEEVAVEDIGLLNATSDEQRDIQLEELYWMHVEHFPMHLGPTGLSKERFDALVCVLAHGRVDQITSRDSTFGFTEEKCGKFLEVLNASKDHVADGNIIWIYARLWHEICSIRFQTFYDDKYARITRSQAVLSEYDLAPTTKFTQSLSLLTSLLSFNISQHYLIKLNDVFVDQLVYEGVWEVFMPGCIEKWSATLDGTTMLLLLHGLLFLLNADATLTAISATLTIASFVTAKILLHSYDSVKDATAPEIREYLESTCSRTFKFHFVALTFALPQALQIWGLLVLLANLSLILTRRFGTEAALIVSAGTAVLALGFVWTTSAACNSKLSASISCFGRRGEMIPKDYDVCTQKDAEEMAMV